MPLNTNLVAEFHRYAHGLVARHPKAAERVMAVSYVLGSLVYGALPAIKNGFFDTVLAQQPDWSLLLHSYEGRPLPFATAGLFIVGSFTMAKSIGKGFGIMALGTFTYMADLAWNGHPWIALGYISDFAGSLAGAFHLSLERKFGHHPNRYLRNTLGRPLAASGFIYIFGNGQGLGGSLVPPTDLPLATALTIWLPGNYTSILLPPSLPDAPAVLTPAAAKPPACVK